MIVCTMRLKEIRSLILFPRKTYLWRFSFREAAMIADLIRFIYLYFVGKVMFIVSTYLLSPFLGRHTIRILS